MNNAAVSLAHVSGLHHWHKLLMPPYTPWCHGQPPPLSHPQRQQSQTRGIKLHNYISIPHHASYRSVKSLDCYKSLLFSSPCWQL